MHNENHGGCYERLAARVGLMAALALATQATAQEVAPGWRATGHWQCGPVRVISSTDGFGGVDFYVIGAWFDNHYTLQRGQLFYNGVPCLAVGDPLYPLVGPAPKRRAAKSAAVDECNNANTVDCEPIGKEELVK